MSQVSKNTIKNLIIVPAIITLAITLLRLTGELMNWSPAFFNKSVGGGGAVIGISWLVPVFGFYFAYQLMKRNDYPAGIGRVLGFSFLEWRCMPAYLCWPTNCHRPTSGFSR